MATPAFNRGLCDAFVEVLNNEYEKGGWWRNLVDDKETFLAIRENYLNVYYRGNSLLKLDLTSNGFRPYIDSAFRSRQSIYEDLADVRGLKNAVNSHIDNSQKGQEEKSGVHDIIHNSFNRPKVLDVEIAFGRSAGRDRRQVDIAALCAVGAGFEVSFYEAKRFSSDDLKARGKPKVIEQIDEYAHLLRVSSSKIEGSYRKVCRNLVSLRGIAERLPERHELLQNIADGSAELRIDPDVWLIVFGFDPPQKVDETWKKHEKKLCDALNGRLFMKGDPKD